VLGIRTPKAADAKSVVERMVLAMINEASLILDEKIVASAAELDLAMIMGTGFPPFRGGLLRYADALGVPYVVSRLDELSSSVGPRFRPNEPLKRLAERDGKFYQTYVRS
jgi:3-hydroxyacyl-CoA dehydrogenase/enoyl-CoA hydratase/3-hydroxybutyryl-CoA epimerase